MARISKSGLDYFPLDVNFLQDRKVRRISSRHHAAGIAALTSLFCLIYKEKGYYVPWNQDTLFDVAQEACCEEAEMQAIIDDCLAVGLFDPHIYKVYSVLTSQVIQEQYHKIITDSRRKYKLPLEHFWLIKEDFKDVTESHDFATTMPQTKEETDTDIKGKQERNMENEIKSEIKKDIETEREGKDGKENERSMPPVPSNSVFQASPVVVEGLSLDKSIGKETVSEGMQAGGGSEAILLLNMQTIGIRNEQTVKAIVALARRKELGGPGGILWKILSSQYRPTLLKKNEPGDYILWALNHPTEFENTYNGTLKKLIRGR